MLILRYTIRTDWVKKLTVDSLQFETECIQQVVSRKLMSRISTLRLQL